jgi:hypothetical protein
MPSSRIMLQHSESEPLFGYSPVPALDAHFTGTGIFALPNVLLDSMYGAVAYQCWGGGQGIATPIHGAL